MFKKQDLEKKLEYIDVFGHWFFSQLDLVGEYGMPAVGNFDDISAIDYMACYSNVSEYHKTENTAVCFYQFDRTFDGPYGLYNCIRYREEERLAKFRERFKGVKWIVAPDFAIYGKFPKAWAAYNTFKSRVCAWWLAANTDAKVIPNVRWVSRWDGFPFAGIKKRSNVAVGLDNLIRNRDNREMFLDGFEWLVDEIEPRAILVRGYITKSNIDQMLGYALDRGIKIVIPHAGIDCYKDDRAIYGLIQRPVAKKLVEKKKEEALKREIALTLDWNVGPIISLSNPGNGKNVTGLPLIDKDQVIQGLIKEMRGLFDPLYTEVPFSKAHPTGYVFDMEGYRKVAPALLELNRKLVDRLNAINDGSYVLTDWLSGELERLIEGKEIVYDGRRPKKSEPSGKEPETTAVGVKQTPHQKKTVVTLLADWKIGPIVGPRSAENLYKKTGIDIIDGDAEIAKLGEEIGSLYYPLFIHLCSVDPVFVFDYKTERKVAPTLLELTKKLVARLDEINDGSYEVDDRITPWLVEVAAE